LAHTDLVLQQQMRQIPALQMKIRCSAFDGASQHHNQWRAAGHANTVAVPHCKATHRGHLEKQAEASMLAILLQRAS
jgi:hypothetical protein